jgi:hypothetical protein
MSYSLLSQTAAQVADLENAPAVVIGPYLLKTQQSHWLRVISIYAKRGNSREQFRLLYLNAPALALWREMGKAVQVMGKTKRPPQDATLVFGVPFSESRY